MKPQFNAAFWKWFKKSKVVNKRGEPLPVYHGTDYDFSKFEQRKGSIVTIFEAEEIDRVGFFFTVKKSFAESFSNTKRVLKCYLSLQNIADFSTNEDFEGLLDELEDKGIRRRWIMTGEMWEKFDGGDGKRFVEDLIDLGYDGAFIDESDDDGKTVQSYVAFCPHQIKLVDNDGTWDADDSDIRSNPRRRK